MFGAHYHIEPMWTDQLEGMCKLGLLCMLLQEARHCGPQDDRGQWGRRSRLWENGQERGCGQTH
eukprot:3161600-Heterocapsa_arctica.AAC.1